MNCAELREYHRPPVGSLPTADHIARRITEKIFEQRKGHGGAPVSYLQMSAESLRTVIEEAINLDRSIRKE